jgi:hypothetical protein
MAYDVRFLIEYSLPQDIAEVLSENLIALDPDSDDEGSPRRLIARAIESRLVDPTQPPIQLQDYANEQWCSNESLTTWRPAIVERSCFCTGRSWGLAARAHPCSTGSSPQTEAGGRGCTLAAVERVPAHLPAR